MGRPPSIHFAIDQRIGRGVVINPEVRSAGRRAVLLQCECGSTYTALISCLKPNAYGRINTTSCGCARREAGARTGKVTIKQAQAARWAVGGQNGLSAAHPREYRCWRNMMARCYNPDLPKYKHWGGRGIRVCARWHDFPMFLEDILRLIGPCPDRLTLDRIDTNGDYGPGKVRWATYATQNRNRRKQSGTTSQYKGVNWEAGRSKWQAKIGVAGRTIMLGRFDREGDAAAAYQAALRNIEPGT